MIQRQVAASVQCGLWRRLAHAEVARLSLALPFSLLCLFVDGHCSSRHVDLGSVTVWRGWRLGRVLGHKTLAARNYTRAIGGGFSPSILVLFFGSASRRKRIKAGWCYRIGIVYLADSDCEIWRASEHASCMTFDGLTATRWWPEI